MSDQKEVWRCDDEGYLDDVCVPDVAYFRMERMDINAWWIGITRADGRLVHIHLVVHAEGLIAHRTEDA